MNFKLLITTSWTGSRLGNLTKETNKSIIKVWDKEIISYILDMYPDDIEIVVTLWYYGDKVKDFLEVNYPDRKIEYAYVDKYEWAWSSLWYSMLCAKDFLDCPFIFHCNDTIVNDYKPQVNHNWAWWFKVENSEQYTTFKVDWPEITQFNTNKWAAIFDYAHIWVVWIYEYEKFWNILTLMYKNNPNQSSLNDVFVLYEMLNTWSEISFIEFTSWSDTWNIESLEKTKEYIKSL
ncbi:MAG: hypothetical protein ACD_3C00083G0018 [uncultured bacterium (gcode 4)]|uniref:Nucleotidyl transferase domain-containing protein n=1 Tax=uncultured bacterium (gcode 4) TaxID=1234023 RepID=K2GDF5_9BACT|nr:MAG: hypothetical protein ACD_3C00083G0018 [uncultured bacterium (gcode 4)]